MKNATVLLSVLLLFTACVTTQTPTLDETPKVTIAEEDPLPTLSGQWMLTGVSLFADPSTIPEYSPGDVVWNFGEGTRNSVDVNKYDVDKRDFSLAAGTHEFARNKYVISINREYLYTVNGDNLTLDSNINPGMSDDGVVFSFSKMVAPLRVDYPNLSGQWTLKSYSTYSRMDNTESYPAYNDGDVVWSFDSNNLVVTKRNPDEKNDFSLSSGSYQAFVNQYILGVRIEGESQERLYMMTLKGDELILDSNLNPRMGPDDPVLTFKRM